LLLLVGAVLVLPGCAALPPPPLRDPIEVARTAAQPVEPELKGACRRYEAGLDWCLAHRPVVLVVAALTLVATLALAFVMPKGFFPTEDIGQISVNAEAVEDISFPAMSDLLQKVGKVIGDHPAVDSVIMTADETNNGRLFINLKPRGERETMEKVLESLRRDVRRIPGVNVYFNPIQNLRIGGRVSKSRFQYVLKSVDGGVLQENADKLIALMRPDALFRDVTSDAQLKGLQAQLDIDRDKANSLGVNIQDIRTALYSTFGERQVSTIYTPVDSYQVILQATDPDRRDESAFAKIFVRSKTGALVPLSSVSSVERKVGPISINHTGQLQAITVSFNLAQGQSLGEAAKKIERHRQEISRGRLGISGLDVQLDDTIQRSEHLAAREVEEPGDRAQDLALRALAGPGRAKEQDGLELGVHRKTPAGKIPASA